MCCLSCFTLILVLVRNCFTNPWRMLFLLLFSPEPVFQTNAAYPCEGVHQNMAQDEKNKLAMHLA